MRYLCPRTFSSLIQGDSDSILQALDFVIAEAQKHGVKLLLTLVNNLQEYGGKSQYVQWARDAGVDPGGLGLSNDEFFVVPAIRNYYKAHVKVRAVRSSIFIINDLGAVYRRNLQLTLMRPPFRVLYI